MKIFNFFILLSLFFGTQLVFSQEVKPEKVHSIIYIRKDFDWYVKQHELWEKELTKNKKNPEAWVNVITAARMAKITSPDEATRQKWSETEKASFNGYEKYISGTYEFWILKRWQSFIEWDDIENPDELKNRRAKIQEYCLNAYKIDPNRPEVYGSLMNWYIETGNDAKTEEISIQWLASGDITYSLYALNFNMLTSCSENAILFTHGDNDTYPSWVLQYGKKYREDVTIINVWLAHNNREYRNQVFKKANLPSMPENPQSRQEIVNFVLQHVNHQERNVCFAPGFYAEDYDSLSNKVFNIGAALIYAEHDYNNTAQLIYFFENEYLLDHLKSSIQHETWPEKAKEVNFLYVSGLFTLAEHYYYTKQDSKLEATKEIVRRIVSDTPYEKEVIQAIENYKN